MEQSVVWEQELMPVAHAMTGAAAVPQRRAAPASPTGSTTFAIASLDGLRAVAIAVVVGYHYGHLSGGFLGVDLFFVLSGYLITRLLLAEQQRAGRFGLGWFWARRVRRLAPAIIVALLTVLVWVHFLDGPSLHRQTAGQARSALIYGSNWYNVVAHVGYWDVNVTSTPLNHLWSLAIEEQFYLVWPLVAAVFLNRWRRPEWLAWLAVGLAVVSMILTPIVYSGFGVNAAYLGTETRVGAILLGAALALFAHRGGVTRTAPSRPAARLLLNVAAAAGAAWFGYACVTASVQSTALYRGGLAASSVAELALVAAVALYPGGVLDRVLGLAPIVALGRRSYSLYLWHYPIYALLSPQWTSLTGHALLGWRIGLTATATEVSYRLVEAPIRRAAIPGRRLVVAALVPALGVLAVSFVPLPSQPPANVVPSAFVGKVPAAAANLRIMVAGDSWAERTAYGMRVLAPPRPGQVFDDAMGGCGIADPIKEVGSGTAYPAPPQCLAWPTRWADTIRRQRPDAVILNVGVWDQRTQQFESTGSSVQPCDDAFQSHYTKQLHTALTILTARHTPVFMTNVRDNDGSARSRSDCMNHLIAAAAGRFAARGVYLLDLRLRLCGTSHVCPSTLHGKRVYDETAHLDISTQVDINAWELNAILAHVQPARSLGGQHQTVVAQIPPSVLALIARLRKAVIHSKAAFPAGMVAVIDPDQKPTSDLPVELRGTQTTIASAVTAARVRIESSAASGKIIGRAYAYRFYADRPADTIAASVQNYLLARHATAHVTSNNQKTFTIIGPKGAETVGFIRTPHLVAIVDLTQAMHDQQHAADSYLAALMPLLGG